MSLFTFVFFRATTLYQAYVPFKVVGVYGFGVQDFEVWGLWGWGLRVFHALEASGHTVQGV